MRIPRAEPVNANETASVRNQRGLTGSESEARRGLERATGLALVKGSLAQLAGSAALDVGRARSPGGAASDGRRDASGGGSGLGMVETAGASDDGPVSGLMATSRGGSGTTGRPRTKRSGCAANAASSAACRRAATSPTRPKYTSAGVKSANPSC